MTGRTRDWIHGGLLCVPACVVTGFAIWFLMKALSAREQDEREGYETKCMHEAKSLLLKDANSQGDVVYVGAVPLDLMDAEGVLRGVKDEIGNSVWGHFSTSENEIVWIDTPQYFMAKRLPLFRLSYFAPLLIGVTVLMIGVVLFLTVMVLRFFVLADKARMDVMSAVAHDLLTPLIGMRMMIGVDDSAAKNLNERVMKVVENFRDYLGMRKKVTPVCAALNLRQLYEESYKIFRDDFRDLFEGEDIAVQVDEGTSRAAYQVWGDEMMVSQILWNLLSNELKYAAPYGRVRVRFMIESTCVKLHIEDDGPGMKPREMRRVFTRYYRAKNASSTRICGFGIGLATARKFARTLGGDLIVGPHQPTGCIFILTLPRAQQINSTKEI